MILHFSIMSDEMNSVGLGMKNRKKVEIGSFKLLPPIHYLQLTLKGGHFVEK